jgi:hypothetical protein
MGEIAGPSRKSSAMRDDPARDQQVADEFQARLEAKSDAGVLGLAIGEHDAKKLR